MKKQIYILTIAAWCSITMTACNTDIDDFDLNTVEGIEALANSGNITKADFNTFVENAKSHVLLYKSNRANFITYYNNGEVDYNAFPIGGSSYPFHPTRAILFCPDGTGRVCYNYVEFIGFPLPPYNYVYRELEWSTDVENRAIVFCDKKLQEEGCEFAVTSLTLKYYDKKSGLYIVEGALPAPKLDYKLLVIAYLSEESATAYTEEYEKYVNVETYRAINDAALAELYPDGRIPPRF